MSTFFVYEREKAIEKAKRARRVQVRVLLSSDRRPTRESDSVWELSVPDADTATDPNAGAALPVQGVQEEREPAVCSFQVNDAVMTWVEALDDWFTFVDGKSQYYLRRTSSLAHFSRGQLVMWKLVCAAVVFMLSVFLPSIVLPWEGFTSTGTEKIPPILYLGPFTALFTVVSLWISAVHLYQPTFTGPRFLSYQKKPHAYSWEMMDWIFYECSTTGTLVAFFSFWTISVTTTEEEVSGIHVEGVIVQFAVVAVDFYHTTPQFKSNHVLLAMLWPSTWLLMQLLWVVGGHQPTNKLFNFHTQAAPLSTLAFYIGTIVSFFLLQRLAQRVQQHHEKRAREVVVDTQDNDDSSFIDSPTDESMRMTQFELMIESSSNRLLRQMSSSSFTNIGKSHTDERDIVPAQVQLHPDTTTTIHIPSSRHQSSLSSNPLQSFSENGSSMQQLHHG